MDNKFCLEILRLVESLAPSVVPILGVWLGWQLGTISQRRQRRLDSLERSFIALREILPVIDQIPSGLSMEELQNRLGDNTFKKSMAERVVRLFGLRRELIPFIDHEFVELIDNKLGPLYIIDAGTYTLRENHVKQFAAILVELRDLSVRVERKLVAEHEKLKK